MGFQVMSGETSLWARQAITQYPQPVHLSWSMTMAHLRPPVGADSLAWAGLTIRNPTTVAAATPATLNTSRRDNLLSVIFASLGKVTIGSFQPRGKNHADCQPDDARHTGESDWADGSRLIADRWRWRYDR